MGVLKRWQKETFEDNDVTFVAKVKCLNFEQAPEYLMQLASFFEKRQEIVPKDGEVSKISASQVQQLYATIPVTFVRNAFEHYIKDVEDLQDEEGVAIVTGKDLYEVASQTLALTILFRIQRVAAGISEKEGKDSPSPSGPSTDLAPSGGVVDAVVIEPEASPAL